MTKYVPLALLATVATLAIIPQAVFAAEANQQVREPAGSVANLSLNVTAGKMLYGPDGHRIASIYRVAANGDAQVIVDGRLLTVPVASLSTATGKVATSLTKSEITHR
ncbi:MAG: hypothetical protein ABIM50_10890 [Novosphingobium sp.]